MGTAANRPFSETVNHPTVEAVAHDLARGVDSVIFLLVGLAAMLSWSGWIPRIAGVDWVAVVAVIAGGYPVFREALENLLARRMTMELSMTLALVAALAIREFSTALFILFFVLALRSWST